MGLLLIPEDQTHECLAASTRQILPTELIVTVSQFLSATDALGSVARLNRISRAVHEETLRVLYETVMWDGKGGCVSEGWRYTRFLILSPESIKHLHPLSTMNPTPSDILPSFPHLAMLITQPASHHPTTEITLSRPISSRTFFETLSRRWTDSARAITDTPERITLSLVNNGRLTAPLPTRSLSAPKGGTFILSSDTHEPHAHASTATLRALLPSLTPASSGEPWKLVVHGTALPHLVDLIRTMKSHVCFNIPLAPETPFQGFQNDFLRIAEVYTGEWHRFPSIKAHTEFFRTQYTTTASHPVDPDPNPALNANGEGDADGAGETIIGTLTSFTYTRGYDDAPRTGFKVLMRRFVHPRAAEAAATVVAAGTGPEDWGMEGGAMGGGQFLWGELVYPP